MLVVPSGASPLVKRGPVAWHSIARKIVEAFAQEIVNGANSTHHQTPTTARLASAHYHTSGTSYRRATWDHNEVKLLRLMTNRVGGLLGVRLRAAMANQ